ncbi:MAG: EAL domain-containing protein [Microcoleaceae cyanobacterium]
MYTKPDQKAIILIVDDNRDNLRVLSDFLDEVGFEVWVAPSGETAISRVKYALPDLILLDVMMPGMDGFQTCSQLQNNPLTKNVPIIFMTALSDTCDKVKGFTLGAVDYITKPFQQEEVLVRIRLHLKLYFLQTTLSEKNGLLERLIQNLEKKVEQGNLKLKQAMSELQETQAKLVERDVKLQYNSFHDLLTGLPNKARLFTQINQAIEFASTYQNYHYAVLLLDIDRFKLINDSLGYSKGDILLQQVAFRLQSCLGFNYFVARLSSDEFVILLEGIENPSQAIQLAKCIQDEYLQHPYELDGYEMFLKATIGITYSFFDYNNPTDLLRDANLAMQKAREFGKEGYAVFEPNMQVDVLERLYWENDLRQAIVQKEFCLYYQPIINLMNNSLKGFEALVRWNHPKRGQVSPAKFITMAEETGLIHDLGAWVLQAACEQLSSWQQQFPEFKSLVLNVNLSIPQLTSPDFVKQLEAMLQKNNLSGGNLKLEITESCLLENFEHRDLILKQIKDLGVKLCIDDFGTGYSSLSRLHEFPIDTLKIDLSFVKRINSSSDNTIIFTIITLARSLNMDVVAEGVETPLQRDILKNLGCGLGQGFLFARPLEFEAATLMIKDFYQQFNCNTKILNDL